MANISLDLSAQKFSEMEDLLETKNSLRKKHGLEILEKLYELVTENEYLSILRKPPREDLLNSNSTYHFLLSSAAVNDFFRNRPEVQLELKKKFVYETIIDPFNVWVYDLVSKDTDIEEELEKLRLLYPEIHIKNFVLPLLFSLTIGKENDLVYLSYKLI
jgi:hypothetical protein